MIKLLIIGSSALMRRQLAALFDAEGDFEIFQASNGKEALEEHCNVQPEVMLLDLHPLELNNIATLSPLMKKKPAPIVVLTSLGDKISLTAIEMLNLDMVSYITRPKGNISFSISQIWQELLDKVRAPALNR